LPHRHSRILLGRHLPPGNPSAHFHFTAHPIASSIQNPIRWPNTNTFAEQIANANTLQQQIANTSPFRSRVTNTLPEQIAHSNAHHNPFRPRATNNHPEQIAITNAHHNPFRPRVTNMLIEQIAITNALRITNTGLSIGTDTSLLQHGDTAFHSDVPSPFVFGSPPGLLIVRLLHLRARLIAYSILATRFCS
jgi:hypothetical protein